MVIKNCEARPALEAIFHIADLLRKAVDEEREFQWEYVGGEKSGDQPDDSFRITIDVMPRKP